MGKLHFALLLAIVSVVSAVDVETEFSEWTLEHNKQYRDEAAVAHAYENFVNNKIEIAKLNADPANTATYALNAMSDLSSDEFVAQYMSHITPEVRERKSRPRPVMAVESIPSKFDYRSHQPKVLTATKDQGHCGNCWAFAATETIESAVALKSGHLYTLSPQQITDCTATASGCDGGNPGHGFDYVIKKGGLDSESSYPYTSGKTDKAGTCKFKASGVEAKIRDWDYGNHHNNETQMAANLVQRGPMAICLYGHTMHHYDGGIINNCPKTGISTTHCIQVVGFVRGEYWIVRNSWGTSWGDNGYGKIKYGDNMCLVASSPKYVIL